MSYILLFKKICCFYYLISFICSQYLNILLMAPQSITRMDWTKVEYHSHWYQRTAQENLFKTKPAKRLKINQWITGVFLIRGVRKRLFTLCLAAHICYSEALVTSDTQNQMEWTRKMVFTEYLTNVKVHAWVVNCMMYQWQLYSQ